MTRTLHPDPYRLIATLAQVPDASARRGVLRRHRQLHNPAIVEHLYEEVARLARVDLPQADRLAQAAAWIAEKLGDDYCRAQGFRAAGHVLLIRGKYAEAMSSYRAALALFRRLGREAEIGRTLYGGSLQALIYLGQYKQAFSWALEARDIFERLGDRLRLARLDNNMGNILYRQDRFREALEYYQSALEEFGRQSQPQDVAITLRNMAVCHISLADFGKALETYREARAHCERNDMPLMVAEADYNIAYLHYQRGEYAKAVDLYHSTRQHCEKLGDPYHKALCDLDQAEMYLELNLDEDGAHLAEQAASSFRNLRMRYEEAKALTFLAVAASHLGRAERALELFGKARKLFVRERNQVWVALIDLYQAVVLYKSGSYEKAQRLCSSAFAFFAKTSLQSKTALCELLRARLHLQMQEYAEARNGCLAALKRIGESDAPIIGCQAYFVLGQVRELQRDRKGAIQAYEKAHALLESLRSHLRGEEIKIAFLKDKLAVYESLVWMCLTGPRRTRKQEKAFAYIEQAKSRSLADLIAIRTLDLPAKAGVRPGLSARVHRLRAALNWHYKQIELLETGSGQFEHSDDASAEAPAAHADSRGSGPANQTESRLERLRRSSRACEDRLLKALAELRQADEEFGVLQSAHTFELEAIRAAIPRRSNIVEYYHARGVIHACVLSSDTLKIIPVASVEKVRSLLRLLQFQLSKFRLGPEYMHRFEGSLQSAAVAHLKDLYGELVAPVRKWLKAENLVVIPHDFLHYLPFHALHDGGDFLIDTFSISYAPSASVYYLCRSKPPASRGGSLILGIPDALTPHILDEVQCVASSLPNPRLFVAEAATEECLRRYGPRSRFVHIATHGLFRQDSPMLSSMRLGDSQLSLLDLYSLRLSSELVTLSGCSTGLNAVVGGDELLGLVRGLLYAGTRAVLVTLWDVDDKSTSEFMRFFYRHLPSASDKAHALREAMREIREEYPHPYYWSPFVLIGNVQG